MLVRCLRKNAKDRFHDVADVRIELTEGAEPAPAAELKSRWGLPIAVGLIASLFGAVVGALFFARGPAPNHDVQRFVITPPRETPPLQLDTPAISDDGRRIAYVGRRGNQSRLYLRELDALGSRAIEGSEGAQSPVFSPDGMWLAFLSGDKLKKVSVLGGAPIDVADVWAGGPGGAWRDNETFWFSQNWISGFFEIAADGGEATPVTVPDPERGEMGHWWPDFLPDGKSALFTVYDDDGMNTIALLDLESREWRHLFPGQDALYLHGYIVYHWTGIYQAVAFDLDRLEVRGSPVPVLENTRGLSPTGGVTRFVDVSDAGTVVAVPGGAFDRRSRLVWLTRDGSIEPLPFGSAAFSSGTLDSTGKRVTAERLDGGMSNIWIYDIELGTEERLTRGAHAFRPRWTPDGRNVVFTSARRGEYDIFSRSIDGGTSETPVLMRDKIDESVEAISPDGRWMAFMEYTIETGEDLFVVDVETGSDPIPVGPSPLDERRASFSRDSG